MRTATHLLLAASEWIIGVLKLQSFFCVSAHVYSDHENVKKLSVTFVSVQVL